MFGGNFEVAATQSQDEIARTFEATEIGGIASKDMSQQISFGFKRSLPLIDDNRNRFCPGESFDWNCAHMRQNEGGKQ